MMDSRLGGLTGVCAVRVDVVNASHGYADVSDNITANLKSSGDGTAEYGGS